MTLPSVQLQALGTFFLAETQGQQGTYIRETGYLTRGKDQTLDDAINLLTDADDIAIYRVSDGTFTDVSREVAEVWMIRLSYTFFPGEEEWPAFVQRHVSPVRLEEVEADIMAQAANHRNHIRSYSNV